MLFRSIPDNNLTYGVHSEHCGLVLGSSLRRRRTVVVPKGTRCSSLAPYVLERTCLVLVCSPGHRQLTDGPESDRRSLGAGGALLTITEVMPEDDLSLDCQ